MFSLISISSSKQFVNTMNPPQPPPRATLSFLRTLSAVSATIDERKTSIHSQPAPKFDRLGRRIPTPPSVVPSPSPPLRKHSSMDSIDLPETEESIRETRERRSERRKSSGRDEEFMRAKTLLAYYNNRHKLQERAKRGMKMSQERVNKALNEQAEKRHQVRKRVSAGKLGVPDANSYF
ncbi:hypothetical protein EAE96_002200 [Botrytis aclada]|nr:hypothetical protein EAE96_002200 [Botrytis aclada]